MRLKFAAQENPHLRAVGGPVDLRAGGKPNVAVCKVCRPTEGS